MSYQTISQVLISW